MHRHVQYLAQCVANKAARLLDLRAACGYFGAVPTVSAVLKKSPSTGT